MFVLGTAGHVDHGKSSFLRAITGMEPDRLPEEKKRGLTLNLNFLWSEFSPFGKVGFIDVPGHHRYINNMISGVGEISGFILLVAADDGWMPQTQEHVQILSAFGIEKGLVVISKIDCVEPSRLLEVEKEIKEKLSPYFPHPPEVVHFSQSDPKSHVLSKSAISRLLSSLNPPQERSSARLFVDRTFLAKGMGVIATGTLTEGSFKVGQKLHLWPAGKTPIVRSLQVYQEDTQQADPVSRVALQLSQIEKIEVSTHSLLSSEPVFTSRQVDLKISFFNSPPRKNIQLKALWGTVEESALFIPGSHPQLGRIQFQSPVPLRFGDRLVLRSSGGETLLAAGFIVDPLGRSKNKKQAEEILGDLDIALESFLKLEFFFEGVVSFECLFQRSVFDKTLIQEKLVSSDHEQLSNERFARKSDFHFVQSKILEHLKMHSSFGLREVKPFKSFPGSITSAVIEVGLEKKWWEGTPQEIFALRNETPLHAEQLQILKVFDEKPGIFSVSELSAFFTKEILKKHLSDLVKREKLISLKDELYCLPPLFEQYQEKVVGFLEANGQATPSQLKEVLDGLSRKYSIPLLEKMDQKRITYLKDGVRKLLK